MRVVYSLNGPRLFVINNNYTVALLIFPCVRSQASIRMSPAHLQKKSFGSLPLRPLVMLSGSYIVLAANGPHLPSHPSSLALTPLPLLILSLCVHSPANRCLFSSTIAKCYRYNFGCQELIILCQLFSVEAEWSGSAPVCTLMHLCMSVCVCVHGDPAVILGDDR